MLQIVVNQSVSFCTVAQPIINLLHFVHVQKHIATLFGIYALVQGQLLPFSFRVEYALSNSIQSSSARAAQPSIFFCLLVCSTA